MSEAHDEAKTSDEPQDPAAAEIAARGQRSVQQFNYLLRVMRDRFPEPPPCPWCHHNLFTIGEVLNLHPRDGGVFGAGVYGMFQVTCATCGYVQLFNALAAGVGDVLERAIAGEDVSEADLPPPIPPPTLFDQPPSNPESET